MSVNDCLPRVRECLAGAIVAVFVAVSVFAQIAPPRTLEELKEETQKRVDGSLTPAGGLKSEDAREALANLHGLGGDEWATAWSAIAERYQKRAKSEEVSNSSKDAQYDYLMAWRYYSFARWPVPNSPSKEKAYQSALAAFRDYTRFLDPPLETVHIPFEGKEIVGYLRLPKGVRPAPLVLTISALDSRKEDGVQGEDAALIRNGIGFFAVDQPGTGEAPIRADVGAERMFSRVLDYLPRARRWMAGASWSEASVGAGIGLPYWPTWNGRACVVRWFRAVRSMITSPRNGRSPDSGRANIYSTCFRRVPPCTASRHSTNFSPMDRACL